MRLVLCVDTGNGVAFNGRRQSRDRRVREDLLAAAGDAPVWTDPYAARQFTGDQQPRLSVAERPWERAEEDGFCFLELSAPEEALERAEELWLYRWDKAYPADTRLALSSEWTLAEQVLFPGHSHETITREVYRR